MSKRPRSSSFGGDFGFASTIYAANDDDSDDDTFLPSSETNGMISDYTAGESQLDRFDGIAGNEENREEQFQAAMEVLIHELRHNRSLMEHNHPLRDFIQRVQGASIGGGSGLVSIENWFDRTAFESGIQRLVSVMKQIHAFERQEKQDAYNAIEKNEKLKALDVKQSNQATAITEWETQRASTAVDFSLSFFKGERAKAITNLAEQNAHNKIIFSTTTTTTTTDDATSLQEELKAYLKTTDIATRMNIDAITDDSILSSLRSAVILRQMLEPTQLQDIDISQLFRRKGSDVKLTLKNLNLEDMIEEVAKQQNPEQTKGKGKTKASQKTVKKKKSTGRSSSSTSTAAPSSVTEKLTAVNESVKDELGEQTYDESAYSVGYRRASIVLLILPAQLGLALLDALFSEEAGDYDGLEELFKTDATIISTAYQTIPKDKEIKTSVDLSKLNTTILEKLDPENEASDALFNARTANGWLTDFNALLTGPLQHDNTNTNLRVNQNGRDFFDYVRKNDTTYTKWYGAWLKHVDKLFVSDHIKSDAAKESVVQNIATIIVLLLAYDAYYNVKLEELKRNAFGFAQEEARLRARLRAATTTLAQFRTSQQREVDRAREEAESLVSELSDEATPMEVSGSLRQAMQSVYMNLRAALPAYQRLPESPLTLALSPQSDINTAFVNAVAADLMRTRVLAHQTGYTTNERLRVIHHRVAAPAYIFQAYTPIGPNTNGNGGWRFQRSPTF